MKKVNDNYKQGNGRMQNSTRYQNRLYSMSCGDATDLKSYALTLIILPVITTSQNKLNSQRFCCLREQASGYIFFKKKLHATTLCF